MGFNNPEIPWSELERVLSGKPLKPKREPPKDEPPEPKREPPKDEPPAALDRPAQPASAKPARALRPVVYDPITIDHGDGGDTPAWTRKRAYYTAPELVRQTSTVEYAELHCHSNFSFLDGASDPERLAEQAVRLGLTGLALTDHDGLYGVVRFAEAAANPELQLPTIFGAELSLELPEPQNGVPDPVGSHLLVLANDPTGYARLSRTISEGQLAGQEKGRPVYDLDRVSQDLKGHAHVLTGCRKGSVPRALVTGGRAAAARELDKLVDLFGREYVLVELTDHGDPGDGERNDALAELAAAAGLPVVATNNVHYAEASGRRLATALAAVRARRSLDEIDGWLPAAGTAHLRSGAEMAERFGAYPAAVARTGRLAAELAFDLRLVGPRLPDYDIPEPGHTEMSWLRHLTYRGAADRYGTRAQRPDAYERLDHELAMIEQLKFPGYFLVVYDIVTFCHEKKIFCQGRGSAANSAVCYALRITNVDAVKWGMLFERFLAPERDGPPDIDVDIESGRREEVIQHVYLKYGRRHTAQVANVISYRPKSAVRDIAKAFGYSPGQQDAWSKQIDRWGAVGVTDVDDIPPHVVAYANELLNFPRHLGIHSGGMVICDRPVIEVCPVEWARMENRTVLQWDKDDCAMVGLVKFDLLGLGMLSALHYAADMVEAFNLIGPRLDLAQLDLGDQEVYRMLCRADSVGVFQVESRAQMATLPRLKPTDFYHLVVEVALIRPGPIQGGSVHPYIRRINGKEPPTPPHPLLQKALERTLGVPLFQEQLMQMAIDVAGFDAAGADELRRAMGSKRSAEKMQRLKERLYAGMAANGISGELADDLFLKLSSFANYGFPESHAMSFAYLVFASAWLKRYHPAAFCAALINAQPMGFYSTQTLVDDARRHGVTVRRPDINASAAAATLEPPVVAGGPRNSQGEPPSQWGIGGPVVRLGLSEVRTIGDDLAKRIEAERTAGGPYTDLRDLARRLASQGPPLTAANLEALATADAFACFGLSRREALWAAGAAAQERSDRLAGTTLSVRAPMLPGMDEVEHMVADVWATGLAPDCHPVQFAREYLDQRQAVPIGDLASRRDRERVLVGGVVTHRQRPSTAGGITFLNLEDETGMLNVVCSPGLWLRHRRVARTAAAMLVRGTLELTEGVVNLVAERLDPLVLPVRPRSRDFR
jgi:error-prone DNA polymerase